MELHGTLNIKDLLKCFTKDQFPMLSDSGLASKNPVLKPWFSARLGLWLCVTCFCWRLGFALPFAVLLTCRLLMSAHHWLLFMSPALGTAAPGALLLLGTQ